MENRKYYDWIIANVNKDDKVKQYTKTHPQTGLEVTMYHLNHLVRIGGQHETVKDARNALGRAKMNPLGTSEELFGDYLETFTVKFSNDQRLITAEDFFEKVFLRLRPGQNGYLPHLARECHKVLGNAVTIGCQKAEAISRDNRERRGTLSTDLKNTMNLMEKNITQDIEDEIWAKDFKIASETSEGYVYMITSPLLCAVKIGHWGGTLDSLRDRYVTPYGPDLTMHTTWVSERQQTEKELHVRFAEFRIVNELFRKDKVSWYLENWV